MRIDDTVALISLDEAKEYLGVSDLRTDEILKTFLNAVGAWVVGYLGRPILAKTHTEYYSGPGGRRLLLRNIPVISITSIHVDSLRQWASDTAINVASDVMVNREAGILTAWNNQSSWPCGSGNIKVVYRAGYTLDTMPHDIRLGVKRIMDKQLRQGFTHHKLDISSETAGEQTTTFREDAIPKDVISMLERYKEHAQVEGYEGADA